MSRFSSTSPAAVIRMLLLTLTTILTATSDQEFGEAYYKNLGPGYSYRYIENSPTESFFITKNLLECAFISLNSESEFFTYNKSSRFCKNYSPKNIMTVVSANDTNEMSYYRDKKWIKIYSLSMGAGSKVYNSYANRDSPSTWNVDKCQGTFCPNFFRHPILDFWDHLPVYEVKLVIYENETAVVNMVFDGRDTDYNNWFTHAKLKSSPWNDLSSATPEIFALEAPTARHFVIESRDKCSTDNGWLAITQDSYHCTYEVTQQRPAIRYSGAKSKVIWNNGFRNGDSMAIFIRLKP